MIVGFVFLLASQKDVAVDCDVRLTFLVGLFVGCWVSLAVTEGGILGHSHCPV